MKKLKVSLVWQIIIGFILGIALGAFLYHFPEHRDVMIKNILQPAGDIFLKMMKMIVIPVVFCCMVLGIAGQNGKKSVGRIGLKTMIYFFSVTTTAIVFGLLVGNIMQPGAGADLSLLRAGAVEVHTSAVESHGIASIITNIIPENIFEAMVQGKILSVLFFAVLFGLALNMMEDEKRQPVIAFISGVVDAMFRVTNFIMAYSPIGVCAMIAVTISTFGFSSLVPLAKLVLVGYGAAIFFAVFVLGTVARCFGINIFHLARYIKDELILTYSSCASAAVIPRIIQKVEELGAPKSIAGFVVPIGYSFNLDGTSIFLGIATLFITQLYGIDLSISEQAMLVITMVVTTKGAAGVPGFMFVILSATLSSAGLPIEGIAFIAGIYRIIDMCNATMNVFGNALAPLIITKWEMRSKGVKEARELADT
ncbi:cation:dicarboxylase symporter family transporter [Enterobacteriaceae bacterium RIT697]|uniref:cation:dicarboxylate symporter family transporter n=1 Tax=Pantoea endophytica TaxID=92488 RepID=UPI0012ADC07D|nr:cation:dicarboxylase symporter family transporter [Pantoea endophytica]MRT24957.1 cation:dicarboxylase symporter family transporter [Enterobacteriaceae bacterium RIT697]